MNDKDLTVTSIADAAAKVPDIKVVGNGDAFKLLSKASSDNQGWMKSTKAMTIPNLGVIVQVTTQQKNADFSYSIAEALTYVDGVKVVEDVNGGNKLVPITPLELYAYSETLAGEMSIIQQKQEDLMKEQYAKQQQQQIQPISKGALERVSVRNIR